KTGRSIAKLPTQFLSCVVADVADFYAQEQKVEAGLDPKANFPLAKTNFWKAVSWIAWGFELIYQSALEPVKTVKDAYEFGRAVAGEENPATGYALGILIGAIRAAIPVVLTIVSFG